MQTELILHAGTVPDRHALGRMELAAALGFHESTLDRLDAAGKLPRACKLGGRKLWSCEVIELWVRLGMPGRQEYEAIQPAQRNGRPR